MSAAAAESRVRVSSSRGASPPNGNAEDYSQQQQMNRKSSGTGRVFVDQMTDSNLPGGRANSNSNADKLVAPIISPSSNPLSYDEVMSPRQQQNGGKRFLGGYLHHRVTMAGGFLKSWKRKYFRLRDHAVVGYKSVDDPNPILEIVFTKTSQLFHCDASCHHVLQLGSGGESSQQVINTRSDPRYNAPPASEAGQQLTSISNSSSSRDVVVPKPTAEMQQKLGTSLILALGNVDCHRVGASTSMMWSHVENPVYLKAESEQEFRRWVQCLISKVHMVSKLPPSIANGGLGSPDGASDDSPTGLGKAAGKSNEKDKNKDKEDSSMGEIVSEANLLTDEKDNRALFDFKISNFREDFVFLKEIGEGSFSIVHQAVNKKTFQLCAVKCCRNSVALQEEIAILTNLPRQHPNIIALQHVYMEENASASANPVSVGPLNTTNGALLANQMVYVVMDVLQHGDLCDLLIQKRVLDEKLCKKIICQVALALAFLHDNCIIHRDIKPENILLFGDFDGREREDEIACLVKLGDFGLAKRLPTCTAKLKKSCGTLEYAAPELLCGQPYGLKADVFSLGIVMYVLLFGAFPFSVDSAERLQHMERFPQQVDVRDMSCLSKDNVSAWQKVSAEAQDLILKMLCVDVKSRIAAKDILEHPWLRSMISDRNSAGNAPLTGRNTPTLKSTSNASANQQLQQQPHAISEKSSREFASTSFLEKVSRMEQKRLENVEKKGFMEIMARGIEVIKHNRPKHNQTTATTTTANSGADSTATAANPIAEITSPRSGPANSVTSRFGSHTTVLRIDFAKRVITWSSRSEMLFSSSSSAGTDRPVPTDTNQKRKRFIAFDDIASLLKGNVNFTDQQSTQPANCFSILSNWRSLEIEVKHTEQRDVLLRGLENALGILSC